MDTGLDALATALCVEVDDFVTRLGSRLLKPIRQVIESAFNTLKDQLGIELHGGRTQTGVSTIGEGLRRPASAMGL